MDGTIAHYTGLMPADDSVIPECALLNRNEIKKASRDVALVANFLCELPADTGIEVLEQRSNNSSQMLISNLSTHLFPKAPFVECPDGHVTHVYLACDVHSACFALDFCTSVSCPATLTPLPPSFTCNNGVQHVPYTLVCDHRSDCSDRSDERFCVFTPCNVTSQFECRNQQVRYLFLFKCSVKLKFVQKYWLIFYFKNRVKTTTNEVCCCTCVTYFEL